MMTAPQPKQNAHMHPTTTHLVTPVPIIHREQPCPVHARRERHVAGQVHSNGPVLHVSTQVLFAVGTEAPAAGDPKRLSRALLLGKGRESMAGVLAGGWEEAGGCSDVGSMRMSGWPGRRPN